MTYPEGTPEDDEVLVTKWLMIGGVLWHTETAPEYGLYVWFAIERGKDQRTGYINANGHTPTHAILRYLELHGSHEWLAPIHEHVRFTMSSARGLTSNHTAR